MAERPPLLHYPHQSSQVPERQSVHGGAPPLAPTYFLSITSSIFCPLYLLGRPAAMNPQVIQIQSDRPVFLVLRRLLPWIDPKRSPYLSCSPTGCCHGKIQSDLPDPSLLKRARTPSGRPPLAFSRSCWLGSYLSSSSLMTFIPPIHPRISSLSRITGCASTPTPLGAPPLVVWLGLTTSWRRTTERKLSGLWTVRFTCFTKSWVGQVACALQLTGTR